MSEPEFWEFPPCYAKRIKKILPANDPNYDPAEDEGLTQMTVIGDPHPVPAGASLDTELRRYRECEEAWKSSAAHGELDKLISQLVEQDLRITKCICFALSSPTARNESDQVMYQLAAFKSVVDIATAVQTQPPEAFAQDPLFNGLDEELLGRLNISVVNHPAGFHHIDRDSFVYCPYATSDVIRGILVRSPAIYMAPDDLNLDRCYTAEQFPDYDWSNCEEFRPIEIDSLANGDGIYESEEYQALHNLSPEEIKAKRWADGRKGERYYESFKRNMKCSRLPFRGGNIELDNDCYHYVYSRPPATKAEGRADSG